MRTKENLVAGVIAVILVAALAAAAARAGIMLTDGPGAYELRQRDGTPVSRGHANVEACRAAITEPGEYRCVSTGVITAVGVCDDVPPPAPAVDAEGFTLLGTLDAQACPDGSPLAYRFSQVQPVRDPWPSCAWMARPVPLTDCVTLIDDYWSAP